MRNAQPTSLDPAHILAVCARSTGGRRGLAVRQSDGIVVCLMPSRRTAYRASIALARMGYEVTGVSASRGRDLLVTGWDTAALDSRLTVMRAILHKLTDDPLMTARAAIKRFRGLPAEARTSEQTWEFLNGTRTGLRNWVTARSGVHALRDSAIRPADAGIALRLHAARMLEQTIDDNAERQLRVAGCALVLFRRLSAQTDGDQARDAALRWAGMAFHLSGPAARRTATDFPRGALTPGPATNVVRLDSARRNTRPAAAPRLRP